nr:probable protein phosphatase 2C 60 isoform X2 [Tanacetum cinerariifolium]
MEDAHAAHPDLNGSTSFFGVCDGHGGKVVAKFCAKFLHQQVLKQEAYPTGDIETSVQKPFLRMDEMIRGQRGWRELLALGDKINKFTCVIEGLIWSPRGGEGNRKVDEWAFEEYYCLHVKRTIGMQAPSSIVSNIGDHTSHIAMNQQPFSARDIKLLGHPIDATDHRLNATTQVSLVRCSNLWRVPAWLHTGLLTCQKKLHVLLNKCHLFANVHALPQLSKYVY